MPQKMKKQRVTNVISKKPSKSAKSNSGSRSKAVAANAAIGRVVIQRKPTSNGKKRYCITHRELFDDIEPGESWADSLHSYRINPANSTTFPWLNKIATNFEYYKFRKLVFEYVPRCSSNTTGTILLAVELDPADPAPTSRRTLSMYEGSVMANLWLESKLRVTQEQLKMKPRLYTRSSVETSDVRFCDFGTLYVSCEGNPQTASGQLFVSYDIEFYVPQIEFTAPSLQLVNPTRANVTNSVVNVPTQEVLRSTAEALFNVKTGSGVNPPFLSSLGTLSVGPARVNLGVAAASKAMTALPDDLRGIVFIEEFKGVVEIEFDSYWQALPSFEETLQCAINVNFGWGSYASFDPNDLDRYVANSPNPVAASWPQMGYIATDGSTCTISALQHSEAVIYNQVTAIVQDTFESEPIWVMRTPVIASTTYKAVHYWMKLNLYARPGDKLILNFIPHLVLNPHVSPRTLINTDFLTTIYDVIQFFPCSSGVSDFVAEIPDYHYDEEFADDPEPIGAPRNKAPTPKSTESSKKRLSQRP